MVTAGDEHALEVLYDRYGRAAYALALRIVRDDELAQEVVQEVFLALWRDPARFDAQRGSFSSWLLAMTHHKAVDAVRREESQRRRSIDVAALEREAGQQAELDEQVWEGLRGERVRTALAALPAPQREALLLAYFGGYTQREIAALTDTPLGTVKTRMLAGMRRLRELLQATQDRLPGGPPGRGEVL
ncbi:MAG: sigma-70 family RNA polymerase sigma factor [Streptosporangiales bacterium]|nr:sigma-70 family RNA polymerase sigma factor [Streptosporangiales bacterium]